ncbi:DUF1559 family PulG-like putative transporter [Mucisphaera calidilacus]|uniref:DUF1559 domain-containing protein n=1 Tax=Mucisphaera calidilacus TaxID=2527982 RepID=A0A518BUX4_9BACT|nr:DUF1559 domain-containing protein [Mucisphaera calidilacus]QDU70785.1 hypothetical protein Pan265_06220 [Mucisphaera calidilacus]
MGCRKKGFTLIELLVVISIIGLLLAILLPALSSARPVARRMQCMSQLRQLAVAEHVYHEDYKRFARLWAGSESDGEAESVTLVSPLQDYLGADGEAMWSLTEAGSIMHCPEVEPEDFADLLTRGFVPYPGEQISSYGINGAMYFDRWGFTRDVVPDPAGTILLGDQALEPFERMVTSDGIYVKPGGYVRWARIGNHTPERGYRHQMAGANMVFVDGHAAPIEHDALAHAEGLWHWWDAEQDPWDATGEDRCACQK